MQPESPTLKTTGVTLDGELLDRLQAKAKSLRRSVSSLLEEWIQDALSSRPKTK